MYHGRSSRRPGRRLLGGLAFAALCFAGAAWAYADLSAWEEAGRPERWVDTVFLLLYTLGGKELIAGSVALLGVGLTWGAFHQYAADVRAARRVMR